MSDDDLDLHEDEFLMSTRQRRSNAGSRMKKLLEQELEDMQSKTEQLEEDEVDLLFKEEGEDEDFEEEVSEEDAGRQNIVEEIDGDEADVMFSESEEESGDEDNEEGEKNLRKQEKLESRKRKRRTPAVIKRKRPKSEVEDIAATQEQEAKKKAQYEQIKAETLLVTNRRTSQRSSVVANKMKVYEKLSKAERKRKIIQDRIKRHKESQTEERLTQQDRVRTALETEKFNISSLDKYKEQEISKKQSRIALQQRQKMKFKPGETVLSELSCAWAATPVMELEDAKSWEEQLKKREKKKRRYTRRPQKRQFQDSKKGESEISVKEEPNDERTLKNVNVSDIHSHVTNNNIVTTDSYQEVSLSLQQENESIRPVPGTETDKKQVMAEMSLTEKGEDDIKKNELTGNLSPPVNESKPEDISVDQKATEANSTSGDVLRTSVAEGFQKRSEEQNTDVFSNTIKEDTSQPLTNESISQSEEAQSSSVTIPKQVTFAERPQVNLINSSSRTTSASPTNIPSPADTTQDRNTPDLVEDTGSEEELIYEGPEQLVGKNFITLYSFPTESYRNDINKDIFGENWANGSNHRSSNVETICKMTMPEEKDDFLQTASLTPNLSFLNNLPEFGEYDKKVVQDVNSTTDKELEIEVKTAPPTGVFLPNGFRKKCLISSKECQYFDPKNGVPYSDVETYKTIQDLQDPIGNGTEEGPRPHYQWFGFSNGGIHLDIGQKPAKGVPEGF